ncbi:MAG TPA: adenylate/guanylate cyclase domain-containing protein [Nitrososphaerales archaeon]|nr:adenylate/guanylate cyclase domain-containing protein [Nitrososphaerales archaeon]
MSQEDRRLAAIMFTDIVGYTALTQRDEALSMKLLDEHRSLVRPIFLKHGGREVKTIGDAFLVEFGSALAAVRCAYDLQQSLHELNSNRPADSQVQVRVGIHLGDVIHSENDVLGDAVNVASRIEPLSTPGGICISEQVYSQVRNKFEFPMVSIGRKELKNVGESVEVFRVVLPWEGAPSPHSGVLDKKRIAVLPFTNLSSNPEEGYFADGMTEELISTVSRIEGTEVISRTSVMQYKAAPKPIREISKELEAGTVLEGSVRKAGNRLRVSVQMIDAARDRHVWAESYDRDLNDVFAIQTDIADRVASALKARLPTETPASGGSTENLDAYTSYLRALQLSNEGSIETMKQAIALLEYTVAKDPHFVRAYAKLAEMWRHCGIYEDYLSSMKKGEAAATKALELGPDTADAHAAMATIDMALDRFEGARTELEKAVAINPNLTEAHRLLGEVNGAFGKLEEAIEHFRRADVLDPLIPINGILLSQVLRADGRMDEALAMADKQIAQHPNLPFAYEAKVEALIQMKDYEKASETVAEGIRRAPGSPDLKISLGMVYAYMGRRDDAERILREMPEGLGQAARASARVSIRIALGDLDEAFSALFEQAELHSWWYLIKYDPLFSRLWSDPRFPEFCRKVGLPP